MKFGFYTLGCKVNRFETQALEQLARMQGHEVVSRDADIFIINTCTVTSVSDHKNIRAFHKIRKENPHAVIAACGCFAQTNPDKVAAQPEVDLICGTGDRSSIIVRCVEAAQGRPDSKAPEAPGRAFEVLPAGVPAGRTRALLKVQDGCDNYCSYCIIPYARGHVRSMSFDTVLQQVDGLKRQGVHEIVLTGIEIAAYGRDLPGHPGIADLISAVCKHAPEVRIRLSSLEPRAADEAFCRELSRRPNLAYHFHLSLQSGCDTVLARMNRKYTAAQYLAAVDRLRRYFPGCSITTDLIIGFPGESQEEFDQTAVFVRECRFADMHVFPYSPREGTPAAGMDGQVPAQEKERRAAQMKGLAKEMRHAFLSGFMGQELDVLLEHPVRDGVWAGHAQYHFTVEVETPSGGKNRMARVIIVGQSGERLYGKEI
ncbi:tRNA (N(6)-L-threonylcarbamoyladenosine(37)-C(2))-methylthiotransferase MtaB [Intestinibacillus massiliensis]|uniref:tRNA (N(6)-L-threonylcarbamoyladenosine(37)-C(2))- methylthiotransferase MtaB n=1 Tax=Intestinibacillus massiliensis TaxID=1871029 RepID=UPI0013566D16|nr:tRNA (N(6)-L-threonylcarbamoyladenosine(37)-C(2))-methylthiotransferase MtaB [Intestinibacillus massiliensis]